MKTGQFRGRQSNRSDSTAEQSCERFGVANGARLGASHAAAVVVSVTFGCGTLYSLRETPNRDELPLEKLLHFR